MTAPPKALPLPSNRSFGLLFIVVFALMGGLSISHGGTLYGYWFSLSAITLGVTWLRPSLLSPLSRLWMRFGALLHQVVSPIVIGVIFLAVITPFALVMRVARRDALRRRLDSTAKSYWIPREPPGPNADSFLNQF